MSDIPEWKRREIEAELVNRSPADEGICKWQCGTCSIVWYEPEDPEFDRTQDRSNWPVFCDDCMEKFMEKLKK